MSFLKPDRDGVGNGVVGIGRRAGLRRSTRMSTQTGWWWEFSASDAGSGAISAA